jgi:hypothetical protein
MPLDNETVVYHTLAADLEIKKNKRSASEENDKAQEKVENHTAKSTAS